MKKIGIVGTGYVGLVTGACFADFGNQVTCVDIDAARSRSLREGKMPFFEPGLAELVARNVSGNRLSFTTRPRRGRRGVGRSVHRRRHAQGSDGEADLSMSRRSRARSARRLNGYKVIVTKCTVPIGHRRARRGIDPREPAAPDRVRRRLEPRVPARGLARSRISCAPTASSSARRRSARGDAREIYKPLYLIETPIVRHRRPTAEMIKYAVERVPRDEDLVHQRDGAALCDKVGADVTMSRRRWASTSGSGRKFLHAGPGYGGSCFPKDTQALAGIGDGTARRCGS